MKKKLRKGMVLAVLLAWQTLFFCSNAMAMWGISSWDDGREPSGGMNLVPILFGGVMLYMFPLFTSASIAALSALAIMHNGGTTLAWVFLVVFGGMAIIKLDSRHKQKTTTHLSLGKKP